MLRHLFLVVIIAAFNSCSCTQSHGRPFQKDIHDFKKEDARVFPPANAILFIGSSSFTKWKDVQDYFPGRVIINRGFGGATFEDVIAYANEIILSYKPKQVVIYCGDNDIAAGVQAPEVLQRFMDLFKIIRSVLPNTNIVFVSIKPSPARVKLMPVAEETNVMIRQFLSTYPETAYVDVFHPMLDKKGQPRAELFGEDSLHMTAAGYKVWQNAINPALLRQ